MYVLDLVRSVGARQKFTVLGFCSYIDLFVLSKENGVPEST